MLSSVVTKTPYMYITLYFLLLCSQLSAAEQDLRTSQGGVDDLRSEFAKRIGTTEKKLQTVIKVWYTQSCLSTYIYTCKCVRSGFSMKERDSLKKQLQVLTTDHSHQ